MGSIALKSISNPKLYRKLVGYAYFGEDKLNYTILAVSRINFFSCRLISKSSAKIFSTTKKTNS
jgi:hypothetical protein